MILSLWSGPHYDYPYYMSQWSLVLGGYNPWIADPNNLYGPGHQFLALLFWLHPLAPKALFTLAWFGCFIVGVDAVKRDATISFVTFLIFFATPFFVILVLLYGSEDTFVTLLVLAAIDGRTRNGQQIAPPLLLGFATLTKVYPLALMPFLATSRKSVDWRFVFLFALTVAVGLVLTVAEWGWSVSPIIRSLSLQEGKMLSIFWFLSQSRLSPLVGTPIAQALIDWNMIFVMAGMAGLYAFHFLGGLRALAGTLTASIVLLVLYKVGNPQYFILPVTLSIYFLAVQTQRNNGPDRPLMIAAVAYLLILNSFELWYAMTNQSYGYPQVRATIGLPCFVAGVFLAWRVIVHERRSCAVGPGADTGINPDQLPS
jgi:hypothetical protein